MPVPTAQAATLTVTTTTDELTSPGTGCSLREAIINANTDANTYSECGGAGSGADTITLPAGTYQLTIATTNEDANANGDLDITESLTITGAGASTTIIQQTVADRVLHAVAGNLTLSGVTVKGGNLVGGFGGGLYIASGTTTISNSTFSGNSASDGGGLFNDGTVNITNSTFSGNSASADGGGLFNDGTVNITNSTFSGNSVSRDGGGLYNDGTVNITNSTFSGNSASGGSGGGLLNDISDTANITNSTFSGNSAGSGGGGLYTNGTTTISNSTFSGNSDGGIRRTIGTITIKNTIVANSTSGGNCGGTITDGGNNLDSANTCGFTTNAKINTAPNLGTLTGSPAYFPLNTGSPAIDAGNNTTCANAPVSNQSQNGVTRPIDGDGNGTVICDIGSYEAPAAGGAPPVLPSTSFNGNTTATGGGAFYINAFYGHVHVNTYGNHYGGEVKITSNGTTVCIEVPIGFEIIGPTCYTDREGGRKDFFIRPKTTTTTTITTTSTTTTTTVNIPNGVTVGASGGTFNLPSSGQLVIPPNLVANGSVLKLESVFNIALNPPNGLRPLFRVVNAQIFNSAGTEIKSFTPPLQLCYAFSDSELQNAGGDAKSFVILTSSDGKTLQELATTPDVANKRACANVVHFSLFELAARTPTKIPTTGDASTPLWVFGVVLLLGAGVGWFVMRRKMI